jgi:drug/metabolite transporter (DMT)-like permease
MTRQANVAGAGYLVAATTVFNLGDTFVKLLSEHISIFQVIALRNGVTILLIALAWGLRRSLIRPRDLVDRGVLLRSGLDTVTTLLYLYGVSLLPLANAAALLFASPLLATLLAGLVLEERVGWARWGAVALGFVGVLLVVQPDEQGWRPAALYPLAAAFTMAMADIVTRRIRPGVGAPAIVATNVVSVAVAASAFAVFAWSPLPPQAGPHLTLAAVALLAGYLTYVLAFRRGEVSFVAPFKYAGLPAAMVLGWLAWSHWPTPLVLLGSALIVAAGLLVLATERRTSG